MASLAAAIPVALTLAGAQQQRAGAETSAGGAEAAAEGALRAAARNAQAKKFEAQQLRVNAQQEIAAGYAAAHEAERQATLVASRQIAVAAASGGGASSPGIVNLIAQTAKESSYRSAMAIYGGEDRARALRMGASAKEYEADSAIEAGADTAQAYRIKAASYRTAGNAAMLGAAGSLFSKYGVEAMMKSGSGDSAAVGETSSVNWLDTGSMPMGSIG